MLLRYQLLVIRTLAGQAKASDSLLGVDGAMLLTFCKAVQVVAEAGHHHRSGCSVASKITKSDTSPVHQVGPVLGQIDQLSISQQKISIISLGGKVVNFSH